MNFPRFSIRNLLAATFWLCIWGVVLVNYQWLIDYRSLWMLIVTLPLWLYIFAGPFVVIGSLAGNTFKGFKIGMCLAVAVLAVSMAFVGRTEGFLVIGILFAGMAGLLWLLIFFLRR
jgi:hypothetical protein